jgi:hypothetical protein
MVTFPWQVDAAPGLIVGEPIAPQLRASTAAAGALDV